MMEVSGLFSPVTNNAVDIGLFGKAWNDVFASGTAYLGSVTSTMISPWANNTSNLGAYGNAWKNLYASSTAFLDYVSSTAINFGNEFIRSDADTELQIYTGGTKRVTFDAINLFHNATPLKDNVTLNNALSIQVDVTCSWLDNIILQNSAYTQDIMTIALGDVSNAIAITTRAN